MINYRNHLTGLLAGFRETRQIVHDAFDAHITRQSTRQTVTSWLTHGGSIKSLMRTIIGIIDGEIRQIEIATKQKTIDVFKCLEEKYGPDTTVTLHTDESGHITTGSLEIINFSSLATLTQLALDK